MKTISLLTRSLVETFLQADRNHFNDIDHTPTPIEAPGGRFKLFLVKDMGFTLYHREDWKAQQLENYFSGVDDREDPAPGSLPVKFPFLTSIWC